MAGQVECCPCVRGAGPAGTSREMTERAVAPTLFVERVFAFFARFDELVIADFISGGIETLPPRIRNDLNLPPDPIVATVACLRIVVSMIGMGRLESLRHRTLPSQE